MTEPSTSRRVTCKRPRPNQYFHELLQSLYRDAIQRKSSVVPALKEAISSLEKYPLPLTSGTECGILKGFDQRLCRYIDAQLDLQAIKRFKRKCLGSYREKELTPVKNADSKMPFHAQTDQKGIEQLDINTEQVSLKTNIGNASHKTDQVKTIVDLTVDECGSNNNNENQIENKNAASKDSSDVNIYFTNKNTTVICDDAVKNQGVVKTMSSVNYSLSESWESWPVEDQPSPRCNDTISKIYKPDECEPTNEDSPESNAVTEISSDEESTEPPVDHRKCVQRNCHGHCQHQSFTYAAETFEDFFKEKIKRDAAEIEKIQICGRPRKMYKPAYRSGAYAILVALLEQRNECPYRDNLTKHELIQKAQRHTDQSFTVPNLDSNCTAWSYVSRLINRGMIEITNFVDSTEETFMLTAMGRAVAMELVKDNTPEVTVNDVIYHGKKNDRVPSLEKIVLAPPPVVSIDEEHSSVFIEMPPGTFDIFMLVDKRENFNTKIQHSPNQCCGYERRSLTVGDFVWVARSRKTGQELVLPYIVERKRLDDLASSIKDGRFHEQKFRLRKCGLSNVIYLFESYNRKKSQYGLPMDTLMQAMINTSILEKFTIVQTESWDNTFIFLGKISEILAHQYLPQYLRGCNRDTEGKELMTFEFFNRFSCKNKPLTVRDTFIKMLLQLKGLSIEKALAITSKYSTPKLLVKAYQKCTEKEGELLLANLKCTDMSRNVGPGVSKTVYKLFSKLDL